MPMTEIQAINHTILDVSYKHGLSHLSSCLTAAPIIKEIYETKKPQEKFILSSGHAGLALYATLSRRNIDGPSTERMFAHHGIHPDRCADCGLDCSTGSLGQGLPIALGMALARPEKDVYCLMSDGECAEGSIWEALRIREEQQAKNLKVYFNLNGVTAYRKIDRVNLALKIKAFAHDAKLVFSDNPPLPWLRGVAGHYAVMDEPMYRQALMKLT